MNGSLYNSPQASPKNKVVFAWLSIPSFLANSKVYVGLTSTLQCTTSVSPDRITIPKPYQTKIRTTVVDPGRFCLGDDRDVGGS